MTVFKGASVLRTPLWDCHLWEPLPIPTLLVLLFPLLSSLATGQFLAEAWSPENSKGRPQGARTTGWVQGTEMRQAWGPGNPGTLAIKAEQCVWRYSVLGGHSHGQWPATRAGENLTGNFIVLSWYSALRTMEIFLIPSMLLWLVCYYGIHFYLLSLSYVS